MTHTFDESMSAMGKQSYISCRELIGFIHDYLSLELDDASRIEFERHLAVCPPCRNYLASYVTTVGLVREIARTEAMEEMPEELVSAILSSQRSG